MAHRLVALLIVLGAGFCTWKTCRNLGLANRLSKLSLSWLGLILLQVLLGAATIWTGISALFSWYAGSIGHYTETYGTIAGGTVLLLWLFLTNLTNQIYPVAIGQSWNSAGFESLLMGQPRMWGFRLKYRFGGS